MIINKLVCTYIQLFLHAMCVHVFVNSLVQTRAHLVTVPTNSHQKIVWFDVTMNKVFIVNVLYSPYHL